jgi:hypothetical protein
MYWYDPGDRRLSLLPANHCQLKESSLFVSLREGEPWRR